MKAIVIDGYNAIHKIPSLRKQLDISLYNARSEITKLGLEYKRLTGGVAKVVVVFDGQDRYAINTVWKKEETHVFSKTGKGDQEIIRVIRSLADRYDVIVVTDDNYVRNNARAHNAGVIAVKDFMQKLAKKNQSKLPCIDDEKISHEKAKEINKELKDYWRI